MLRLPTVIFPLMFQNSGYMLPKRVGKRCVSTQVKEKNMFDLANNGATICEREVANVTSDVSNLTELTIGSGRVEMTSSIVSATPKHAGLVSELTIQSMSHAGNGVKIMAKSIRSMQLNDRLLTTKPAKIAYLSV